MRRSLSHIRALRQFSKPFLSYRSQGFTNSRLMPQFHLQPAFFNSFIRYNHGMVPVLSESTIKTDNQLSLRQEEETTYTEDQISVEGLDVPAPFLKFDEYDWPKPVADYIKAKKFGNPTAIQAQAMPIALEGRDLVGIAQTGSGKTLAFILPAIVHIINRNQNVQRRDYIGPNVLVMAPTRELAQQIVAVCDEIGYHSVCLYGGASRLNQRNLYQKTKPQIVIGTPGRVNDFVDCHWLNVRNVSYLVLDEADRMLDLGFEPQIRGLIENLSPDRQTLMWSATWPEDVRTLAQDFLKDYIQITVGSKELQANPNITQKVIFCQPERKTEQLITLLNDVLKESPNAKVLIFCQTKRGVDFLTRYLNGKGIFCLGLHGDKSQTARDGILNGFRSGNRRVLVATDVASRGLDVDDIKCVINFDMPNIIEDYVHRIGRTGRQGKKGESYSFFSPEDVGLARDLIKILEPTGAEIDERIINLADSSKQEMKKIRRYGSNYYDTSSRRPTAYTGFYKSGYRRN